MITCEMTVARRHRPIPTENGDEKQVKEQIDDKACTKIERTAESPSARRIPIHSYKSRRAKCRQRLFAGRIRQKNLRWSAHGLEHQSNAEITAE